MQLDGCSPFAKLTGMLSPVITITMLVIDLCVSIASVSPASPYENSATLDSEEISYNSTGLTFQRTQKTSLNEFEVLSSFEETHLMHGCDAL
jgi:hypothetical protein